jgi:hypothetical protein
VATDAAGNVYVADGGNYRIQKFASTSVVPSLSALGRVLLSTLLLGGSLVSLRRRAAAVGANE